MRARRYVRAIKLVVNQAHCLLVSTHASWYQSLHKPTTVISLLASSLMAAGLLVLFMWVQLHGYTGWPIEVGPEFYHGNASKLTEVVADCGFNFVEKPWPDFYYFGQQRLLTGPDGVSKEVDEVTLLQASVSISSQQLHSLHHGT